MDKRHSYTDKIALYLQQLEDVGYAPYQIHGIISELIGTAKFDELDEQQYHTLAAGIKSYLQFAAKM